MLVIDNENIVCFDCDDTLVMWGSEDHNSKILIECPYSNSPEFLVPHNPHIDLLKKYKGRGMKIIVWTAAGYQWGEAVVKALGLEEYVDYVMTKPCKLVDDLTPNEIFPVRIYLKKLKLLSSNIITYLFLVRICKWKAIKEYVKVVE